MISQLFAMRERHENPEQRFMVDLAKRFAATRAYFPDATEESSR